jgi:2-dehydro-3-deoxygluconokinase
MFRTVDPLGGGDAFCAGFLHGLLTGGQQRALEVAGATAALKQSIPGDWAIVTAADVEDVLAGGPVRTRR